MGTDERRWDLLGDGGAGAALVFRPFTNDLGVCGLCEAAVPKTSEQAHRRWHLLTSLEHWRPALVVHGLAVPPDLTVPVRMAFFPVAGDGRDELDRVGQWISAARGDLVNRDGAGISAFLPGASCDFSCDIDGDFLRVLVVPVRGAFTGEAALKKVETELRARLALR